MTISPRIFRRTVLVDAAPGVVHAGIEDDFHHYELCVRHEGGVVSGVEATSIRTPWMTCAEAGAHLLQLVGHAIGTRPTGLPDPHQQCTHMFELAVVALAQAARGGRRRYDIAVPHRELGGATRATLDRDGARILSWDLAGDEIVDPPPWAGRNLRSLLKRAEVECDDETLEAVRVLRRGVHVSTGRSVNFEAFDSAADIKHVLGACYVFQPVRVDRAARNLGTRRDFTETPMAPLAEMRTPDEEPRP